MQSNIFKSKIKNYFSWFYRDFHINRKESIIKENCNFSCICKRERLWKLIKVLNSQRWHFAGDRAVYRTSYSAIFNVIPACEKALFWAYAYDDERRCTARQNGCREILREVQYWFECHRISARWVRSAKLESSKIVSIRERTRCLSSFAELNFRARISICANFKTSNIFFFPDGGRNVEEEKRRILYL